MTDLAGAEQIADIIAMLMDGIWVRMRVTGAGPSKKEAIVMVQKTLRALLAMAPRSL